MRDTDSDVATSRRSDLRPMAPGARGPKPEFTAFDPPGAGSAEGKVSEGTNPAGVIVGYYLHPSGIYHGFLRNH